MKIKLLTLVVFVFALFASCGQNKKEVSIQNNSLDNEIDSVSYILGISIGNNFKASKIEDINYYAFLEGVHTVMKGDSSRINPMQSRVKLSAYSKKVYEKSVAENKKEGEEFLAANKTKEGVKVTESGIQYIVLKEGKGAIPSENDKVKVHYHGTLIDGKVFDSSVDRGQPVEFPVKGVIKGWQEILQMMPTGSKWKVFIPTELAYGENVRPGSPIEPNMALIFEIELLDILKEEKKKDKKK